VIDWADEYCGKWAAGLRRVVFGTREFPPYHTLDRLQSIGFSSALRWAHPACNPELADEHTKSAHRAVRKLSRVHRDILFAHYLLNGTAISKAKMLGISRRAYYARLHRAHADLGLLLREFRVVAFVGVESPDPSGGV
jgi:hypothetical protein